MSNQAKYSPDNLRCYPQGECPMKDKCLWYESGRAKNKTLINVKFIEDKIKMFQTHGEAHEYISRICMTEDVALLFRQKYGINGQLAHEVVENAFRRLTNES